MTRNTAPVNLADLEEALVRAGIAAASHRELLEDARAFFRAYAALERALWDDVLLNFPAYLFELRLPEDPMAAGALLADRERARLGIGEGTAGDVAVLLDRQGLKVYRPEYPPGSALEGFFLFDAECGPLFCVNGSFGRADSDFAMARLYAHYLVDNDPYTIRILTPAPEAGSAAAVRAAAFAAAFLVSGEGLGAYLNATGVGPHEEIPPERLGDLLAFFEVGPRTLVARLLALGRLHAGQVPGLVAAFPAVDDGAKAPAVPERFVRLVLEANARGILDRRRLAAHLRIDERTAVQLAERFRLDPDAAESP